MGVRAEDRCKIRIYSHPHPVLFGSYGNFKMNVAVLLTYLGLDDIKRFDGDFPDQKDTTSRNENKNA